MSIRTWGIGCPKENDTRVCSLDSASQIWWPVGEDTQDAGGAHGTGSTVTPRLWGCMDVP